MFFLFSFSFPAALWYGADIDYCVAESSTAYGIIGVKVWIFKGDIMEHDPSARDRRLTELKENASRAQKSGNSPQERAN